MNTLEIGQKSREPNLRKVIIFPSFFGIRKVVSNKAKISKKSDSRQDSQPAKLEWRLQKNLKLRFRDLCNSESSGLRTFDIMLSYWVKKCVKSERFWVNERTIPKTIFVGLTDNSFAKRNETQGQSTEYIRQKIAHGTKFHWQHGFKTTQ